MREQFTQRSGLITVNVSKWAFRFISNIFSTETPHFGAAMRCLQVRPTAVQLFCYPHRGGVSQTNLWSWKLKVLQRMLNGNEVSCGETCCWFILCDVKRGNCSEFFHAYVKYLTSFYNYNLNRIPFTDGMGSSEMES